MAFKIMRIPLPTISEGSKNITAVTYNKLSNTAKNVIEMMAVAYKNSGKHRFSLDDLRDARLGNWRKISDALYELESREFGKVKTDGVQTIFSANVAAMQSI